MTCETTCIECGDDIGPHHLCTDCLTKLDAAAYRRGYNDHARTVQHWQDTHGAYRVQPLPPEQNAAILRAAENADVPWNQHGEGENP